MGFAYNVGYFNGDVSRYGLNRLWDGKLGRESDFDDFSCFHSALNTGIHNVFLDLGTEFQISAVSILNRDTSLSLGEFP